MQSEDAFTPALLNLIDSGLTFAAASRVFAARQAKSEGADLVARFIDAARETHGREGAIEIDDDAMLSRSADGGSYVAAWVWVENSQVGL